MSKSERVLSDAEIFELLTVGNDIFNGDSEGDIYATESGLSVDWESLLGLFIKFEQDVLTKLSEQEPIAYKRGQATFTIKEVAEKLFINPNISIEPLYAHPSPSLRSDKFVCVSENGENDRQDPIRDLIATHKQILTENNYAYFELAYTRQTDWMAWICSNHRDTDPNRTILAKGQGITPEEACLNALEGIVSVAHPACVSENTYD